MGCGSGSQNSTVTQTTQPPPQVMQAYQNLLNQGTAVSQLPLQQYAGPTIAGFNPTQQTAFSEINQAQGSALPYINAAQSYLSTGADDPFSQVMTWNPSNLAQFENPYTSQVTQATQNLLNQQNAEQFNQANAAAASEGAFGGDRESVLEGQMAQQQQLAEDPTLAGLQSQGFTTAAGLLGQQQNLELQGLEGDSWLSENAAAMEGGLGNDAMSSLLSGASSELQAGALGQQLEQEELNVPQQQFLQQQAYPFETTNFLAGLTEGVGGGMGGTGSTTSPGPNLLGQLGGLGLTGLGLYGMGSNLGWFGDGADTAALAGTPELASIGSGMETMGSMADVLPALSARGGRVGFPQVRRDVGGSVPDFAGPFPSALPGLSGSDARDVTQALALAGASPVTPPPMVTGTGLHIAAPAPASNPPGLGGLSSSLPGIGALLGGSSSTSSSTGNSGASAALSFLPMVAEGIMMMARRGGRIVPRHDHAEFPRTLSTGGDSGGDMDAPQPDADGLDGLLVRIGAGMMASRSPFLLTQLGEGLQAGLRQASNAPHVEEGGPFFRVTYPGGRSFNSRLPNINGLPGTRYQAAPY